MSATGSKVVRRANKASSSQLQPSVDSTSNILHVFRLVHSGSLQDHERSSIWNLFETNMRDLYSRSSFGWDPPAKQAELFDPLSRFILVQTEGGLIAFAMFRFEYENHDNLLYCYDLQVSSSSRRSGIGKLLLRWLECIGVNWKMDKLVLTVLKENIHAVQFYDAFGFKIDVTSPGYAEGAGNDMEDVDYEILSKDVNSTDNEMSKS